MRNDGLNRVLAQLPPGGAERLAIDAGEIDAVIDYGSANVIVFPAARRALHDAARRASATDRLAAGETAKRNAMLAPLPATESRRLLAALEQVEVAAGDVLQQAGASIRHVYFPAGCVVGLLTQTDDRRTVMGGLVGREGMLGLPLALGVDSSAVRAVVQIAGPALRMSAARFRAELRCCPQLQRRLHRHVQRELNQAWQTAACIASHRFEPRLACWLLMMADRADSQALFLTHEHLGEALNVRRESVTAACSSLRLQGLISYYRGMISIVDRKGVEQASCRCYRPLDAPEGQRGRTPLRANRLLSGMPED